MLTVIRRTGVLLAASAGLLGVWATSALAYVQAPGATITGPSELSQVVIPVTGTCTSYYGTPMGEVTTLRVGYAYSDLAYNGVDGVFTLNYIVTVGCTGGAMLIAPTTVPGGGTYTFNDTAGTLTVTVNIPATFQAPIDGGDSDFPATVSLTSGSGSWQIVYGADDNTEKKSLSGYHRKADGARTVLDRARALNDALVDLVD